MGALGPRCAGLPGSSRVFQGLPGSSRVSQGPGLEDLLCKPGRPCVTSYMQCAVDPQTITQAKYIYHTTATTLCGVRSARYEGPLWRRFTRVDPTGATRGCNATERPANVFITLLDCCLATSNQLDQGTSRLPLAWVRTAMDTCPFAAPQQIPERCSSAGARPESRDAVSRMLKEGRG